jgi:hypothetical protein
MQSKVSLPAVLLLLAVSGCRTTGADDSLFIHQFGPSLAFAPPGMTGWWFCGKRALVNGEHLQRSVAFTEMRCGGFRLPNDSGAGGHERVVVEDYGDSGVPEERIPSRYESERIGGFESWRDVMQYGLAKQEWWCAVVDCRFVVMATSGSLLEAALRRSRSWSLELPGGMSRDGNVIECAILSDGDGDIIKPKFVTVLKEDPWRLQMLDRVEYPDMKGMDWEEGKGFIKKNAIVDGYFSTEFWVERPDEEFFFGATMILDMTFGIFVGFATISCVPGSRCSQSRSMGVRERVGTVAVASADAKLSDSLCKGVHEGIKDGVIEDKKESQNCDPCPDGPWSPKTKK